MGASSAAVNLPIEPGEKMMAAVGRGDSRAFQQLHANYRERIFRYLVRWLGDREEALDVTQEVFCRIYERADKYDSRYPLGPWIYRLASNLCTDHYRRKNFRVYANRVQLPEVMKPQASDLDSPEKTTLGREIVHEVDQALRLLPTRQRQVVRMRLFEDCQLQEIADAQGVSLGTVKSTLHSGLNRLRKHLREREISI